MVHFRNIAQTEVRRALIALAYFTRVPIPGWVQWSESELGRAARYFPAVGVFVGGVGAGVFAISISWLSAGTAVAVSMIATVVLTGAFHEDGLADSADGFGGGYVRERVLEIMRDSRVGSFGALALILALILKFVVLLELSQISIAAVGCVLVVAHALSRATVLPVMMWLPYARVDGDAKAKPVAQGVEASDLVLGLALGSLPLLVAMLFGTISPPLAALALSTLVLVCVLATRYFRRRIQGYTGDCLGATQQVSELALYVVFSAGLA